MNSRDPPTESLPTSLFRSRLNRRRAMPLCGCCGCCGAALDSIGGFRGPAGLPFAKTWWALRFSTCRHWLEAARGGWRLPRHASKNSTRAGRWGGAEKGDGPRIVHDFRVTVSRARAPRRVAGRRHSSNDSTKDFLWKSPQSIWASK